MPGSGGADLLLQVADEMRNRIATGRPVNADVLKTWAQQVEEGTTGLLTIIGQLSQEAVDAAMDAAAAKKESSDAKTAHLDAANKYKEKVEAARKIIEQFARRTR